MTQARRQRRQATDKRVGVIARWLLPSLGGLSALLVLQLLITNSYRFLLDSDTGWHIRTGELILQTGAVPRTDPFSHTMAGQTWFAWEWLADVLMAALHNWRGLAGVVAGAILVLLVSYAALGVVMLRRGADPVIAMMLTVFGAIASIVHWLARPHLISILLMVVWCVLVEGFRRNRSKWIFAVPVLVVVWANLHGAFVVTLVMLGVYAVGEFLELAAKGEWRSREAVGVLKTYLLVGALSAVAAMATPYGVKLYGHLWRYLSDKRLLSTIEEFQSPNFHSTDGKLIEILLLFGIVSAVNALRQRRFVETGLLLLWGHMTLQSERHVTLAVIVLTPFIAEQISNLLAELYNRAASNAGNGSKALRAAGDWYQSTMAINRQLTGASCYVAAVAFVILAANTGLAEKLLSPRFDARRFPAAAVDFVQQNKISGRMYSSDQFGGYLIYRQFKVFVDGRSDFYRQGAVLDELDQIDNVRPNWQELLDKHSVDWMLLKRGEALAQIALFSGKWRSVYEDTLSQVLVRQTPAPQSSIPQQELIQQTVSHNQPATGQRSSGEFSANSLSFAEIQKGEFMTLKKKIFRSLRHPVMATVVVAAMSLGVVSTVPGIRNQVVSNLDSGSNFFWFDDAPESGDPSGQKKGNALKRVFGAPFRLMARMFKRNDNNNVAKKMSDKDLEKMKVVPISRSQNGTPDQIADTNGTAAEATTVELAAQNMFEEAVELHGKGRTDGAMEKLIAATVLQPNFSEAYNLLGVCYDEKGQYESAQAEYKKALKVEPNNARFLNNIGYSFYLANDFGDSVKYYKRGLKITPNDRRMHNNIGLAYGRKGDYDKAKDHFVVAVGEVGALLNLGFIYSQDGKHDDAIKSYQAALKIKPDSLQAMSNLAQLYERKGWLREAGALQAQYKKLSDEEKNKDQVVDREP
ncbi:MAG: tetratricopeptide repeat protein [Acidobacteriota bacterium]|nr:tetratricopeptide repeat protein [Acidobacteriota bacterium]